MRQFKKGSAITAVLLAAAVSATACSSSKSGGSGSAGKPAADQPTAMSANAIASTPRDQIKQGGSITWPIEQWQDQLNYDETDGTSGALQDIYNAVMPQLYHSSASGDITWNSNYVTDAKSETVNGKQVVTFHLNPKAVWSDGTPLTSDDIVATWKSQNGTNTAFANTSSQGYSNISKIDTPDKQTAVATFDTPFSEWKGLFSPLLPAKYISTPDDFNKGWLNKIPATAGPFKIDGIDQTAKTVTVVANPNWWGDKPKLDKIVFKYMKNSAMPQAFANQEIDLYSMGVNADAYKAAKGLSFAEVRKATSLIWRHVTVNAKSPALTDVNVRKALFESIDRNAIGKADMADLDWNVTPLNNHVYMGNQAGFADNAPMKFDPAQAAKDLQAAGYTKDSSGIWAKDGKELDLKLGAPLDTPVAKNESTLLQAMLKDQGIKIDIFDMGADMSKYLTPGQFDLCIFAWQGTQFPVQGAAALYNYISDADLAKNNVGENFTRIGSKDIDAQFAKALADTDPAQTQADANKADQMVWAEYNELPLYQRPDIWAVKKNLVNVGAFGLQDTVIENIGFKN